MNFIIFKNTIFIIQSILKQTSTSVIKIDMFLLTKDKVFLELIFFSLSYIKIAHIKAKFGS